MSNQTAAALSAIGTSVNWERNGLDLQAIIEAGNQGLLGKPLTDWLATKAWLKNVATVYTSLVTSNLSLSDRKVEVHQLVERATFDQMFRGLAQGSATLDDLCVSKDQREKFLVEHLDQFPRDSWMFFLYKEGDSFLVACVDRYSGGRLDRHVYPLSDDGVWSAVGGVRVVFPQRTVKPSVP